MTVIPDPPPADAMPAHGEHVELEEVDEAIADAKDAAHHVHDLDNPFSGIGKSDVKDVQPEGGLP